MKTSKRIATFLIVFVLGIIVCPRAKAIVNHGDSIQIQEDPHKKQKFSGFIIDPLSADRLLFSNHAENETHVKFTSTAYDHKADAGQTLIINSNSKNCCKSNLNRSLILNNNECIKNQTKPKK